MARARSRNGQSAVDDLRAAYDEAPYESYAHPNRHPDNVDAFVFNHWHELLPLSPVDRYLLPLLDGRRDRQALVEALMDVVGEDLIRIDRDDGQILDEKGIRDVLAQQIDALPQRLTEMKLMSVCDHASVIDHRLRA